jgi:hypothetical protein
MRAPGDQIFKPRRRFAAILGTPSGFCIVCRGHRPGGRICLAGSYKPQHSESSDIRVLAGRNIGERIPCRLHIRIREHFPPRPFAITHLPLRESMVSRTLASGSSLNGRLISRGHFWRICLSGTDELNGLHYRLPASLSNCATHRCKLRARTDW